MCDFTGTTWAALALSTAGSYASYKGSKQAENAMQAAQSAESIRQKNLRDESNTLFQQSLKGQSLDEQQKRLGDVVAEREAATTGAQQPAQAVDVPVKGGAPTVVADETASRVSAGNAQALQQARLQAALQGYGDLQLGNALQNARFGQKQANLSRFMTDSAATLGTELEAASRRGDQLKNIGGGLQAAGQLVGLYGAMQPKPVPVGTPPGFVGPVGNNVSLGVPAMGPSGSPVMNGSTLGVNKFGQFVSIRPPGY